MGDLNDIQVVMANAHSAFETYRVIAPEQRAAFLEAIAKNLESAGEGLLELTAKETHLPLPRLRGEMVRTCFQLRMYAGQIREGHWVDAFIDHAKPDKNPPAPDLRSMQVPIGPVVVFGSSNFPYAYSTAGGDSASALAAGCSVVVKQHPAHAETSIYVYALMEHAAVQTGMPPHVIQHVEDSGFQTGKALVQHPATAAVGFTGSYAGGMALHGYAQERKHPIPVFAEMGSVNPVLLLPDALATDAAGIASKYAASLTMGMGQFCTNPGLMFGVDSAALESFTEALVQAVKFVIPSPMLHTGIEKAYIEKSAKALQSKGVELIFGNPESSTPGVFLARVKADAFKENPLLHQEIFGPFSVLVVCQSVEEMLDCCHTLSGQLTTSIMATEKDVGTYLNLLKAESLQAGRVVYNGVPTGVEVCGAMVHGGPYPATTDSRFTAVGPKAIYRWTRPLCWQNAPDLLLPDALKENNPLQIRRWVDGVLKV
jgi:NADP-dependent aldehyde dehydrogenase